MCHSLRFLRLALLLGVAVEAENELGRAVFLRPTRTIPREELLKESGCTLEFREVEYEWTMEFIDVGPIPQLAQFRVDCRAPLEELRALEVWDKHQNCGRVGYTKYLSQEKEGNKSQGNQSRGKEAHTVRKSANGPDIVVLRRGDVIDFHCVLSPMRMDDVVVEHLDDDAEFSMQWMATIALNVQLAKTDISVVGVEMFKVSLPLVATAEKIKEQLDLVLLRESCRDAMKAAYDWKLMVTKSQANRHRVKFSSPQLATNFTRLGDFDDPNLTLKEMGVASFANGLQLSAKATHARCENIPERNLLDLLRVSPVEWADQGPLDFHAVAFDLLADVATLPPSTKSLQVITVLCFLLLGLAYFWKNRQLRPRSAARQSVRARPTVPTVPTVAPRPLRPQEVELQSAVARPEKV
ncbi:unnamed protein product [Cladocopium goreaui]|uniref:Uncharacterized protein n=1 Tax=Cladocopium goreaui TaxID=2562237 RepID=A0A9P1DP45_9DINO|nr:unnamed protein product [Cladocopium goreaui]